MRGWIDLAINGSYWIGTAIGAAASVVLLNPKYFAVDVGWRVGFGIGAFLAVGMLLLRQFLPESPRWLMTHGQGRRGRGDRVRHRGAGRASHRRAAARTRRAPSRSSKPITSASDRSSSAVFGEYWRRSLLGFTLMVSQAFLYNAIFFTYALVLTNFYGVSSDSIGWYLLPFAAGNFLGPLLLGRLFDTVGRRIMITLDLRHRRHRPDRRRLPVPAERDLGDAS